MKRLFELVIPHWRRIVLAGIFSVLVSLLNGSFAWIVKPVVDDIFVESNKSYLALISAAVAMAFLMRGVFAFFQNYLMNSVGAKIVRDIRNKLYNHMVYLPLSRHESDTTGSMMSRLINDASLLQQLLAFRIRDLFVSSCTIVVLTGVAMYRRFDLTLIALAVTPFAFYVVGKLGQKLKRVTLRAQKKIAWMTESLSEGLTGIKVIKSFSMEDNETERFKGRTHDYYREYMRSIRISELTLLVMEVMAGVGVAFIIIYGGNLVADRSMTSGDFFSFLAAILLIYTPAKRLAQVNNGLQQARAYVDRIDMILESPREAEGRNELKGFARDIVFKDVSFKYDGREDYALSDINLKMNKGEVVALVGRSGSGKTTLADLIARFYKPQSGAVLIDGVDIRELTAASLRSRIGVVSQEVFLFNDTVKANIAYSNSEDIVDEDVSRAASAAYAHEFISQLPEGYDTPIGEGGALLSGGQKQRISIARAIFMNPPILILDEATSSLDAQSERMVQKALDRLLDDAPEEGQSSEKTVIVIAHRLSTIRRADRIIVLDKGRIMEAGRHEELLAAGGPYSSLYKEQGPRDLDVSDL
jgi:subfamily B ATP-binding cassette protein MsbA